jgi:hypothetical protein
MEALQAAHIISLLTQSMLYMGATGGPEPEVRVVQAFPGDRVEASREDARRMPHRHGHDVQTATDHA